MTRRIIAAALTAITITACTTNDTATTHPETTSADPVADLTVAPENPAGYNRDLFGDPDRDALLASSIDKHGCYMSAADDTCHNDPSNVHVDHLVPLAEAWASGLNPTDTETFGADPANVWLMTATLNMSKGDSDPTEWLPPAETAVCDYIARWIAVKAEWELTIDQAEADTLTAVLANC